MRNLDQPRSSLLLASKTKCRIAPNTPPDRSRGLKVRVLPSALLRNHQKSLGPTLDLDPDRHKIGNGYLLNESQRS